jgi:hypothetical protein
VEKRDRREWRRCGRVGIEGRRRGREVEAEDEEDLNEDDDDLAVDSRDLDSDPQRQAIFSLTVFTFTHSEFQNLNPAGVLVLDLKFKP